MRGPFPFQILADGINQRIWPHDPVLCELLSRKIESCLQGLYSIITIYLVLSCDSLAMLGKRLLRKVGRQFLVTLFASIWMPWMFYASSPMNCIRKNSLNYLKPERAARWLLFILTATAKEGAQVTEDKWPTYAAAFQIDMQEFLFIGILGILRPRLWFHVLPAVTFLYWACLLGWLQGTCVSTTSQEHEGVQASFWMHWFPTSLIFLNLDTLLRSADGRSSMARVKHSLGLFGTALLVALGLCVSFWVRTSPTIWSFDWQKAGFATCGPLPPEDMPRQLQLAVDLPFEVVTFMALHLGLAPAQAKNAVEARNDFSMLVRLGRSIRKSRFLHLSHSLFYDGLGCLRNVALAFQIWHRIVFTTLRIHSPVWMELYFNSNSVFEHQLLFFAPVILASWSIAWLTYRFIQEPWGKLIRKISGHCSDFVLFSFIAGYVFMCSVMWTMAA
eukprot:s1957_g2.t1